MGYPFDKDSPQERRSGTALATPGGVARWERSKVEDNNHPAAVARKKVGKPPIRTPAHD
jgi:hypothetical protein